MSYILDRHQKLLNADPFLAQKVFQSISIQALLPEFPSDRATMIQHLWDELFQLNMLFCKQADEISADVIHEFELRDREGG